MRFIYALIFWIVLAIIAYFVVAFTGVYQIGADVPHWGITSQAIGFLRRQTVARRVADIKPPPLDDPAMIKLGADHYSQMCTGCHLAPGMGHSELRDGMYPKPPNLTRFAPPPAVAFWVIKHGFKMTGMPAWGETHDDHTIWAIVAYLQKQPRMSAATYQSLTAGAGATEHTHSYAPAAAPASSTTTTPTTTPAPTTTAAPVPAASGATAVPAGTLSSAATASAIPPPPVTTTP